MPLWSMTALIISREDLAAVVTTAVSDALKSTITDTASAAAVVAIDLMTRSEAARYLNVSQDTVKRWAAAGYIPEHRMGRTVRYRRTELDAVLSSDSTPSR